MSDSVDLRSDTVTRPTLPMREAMLRAEVGDVVYDEDPTVHRLEADVARLLGKEAALYVATGTMANTLAIRLCAQPGDEILAEVDAHPLHYEAGGSGAFSGVLFKGINGEHGILDPRDVEEAIYSPAYYRARQVGLLVENTHNRGGGTTYPLATLQQLGEVARRHGLRAHLDGARLWNASVASGVSVADMAAPFDTVSVCFSKALGAPVGSVLAGGAEDIQRAWHYRHMLGGSWRQAGILAAAALYALEHHVDRLADDHDNARHLAQGLTDQCGLEVLNPVHTNMVYFRHADADGLQDWLHQHGILVSVVRPGVIRCVTHLDVDRDGMDRTLDVIQRFPASGPTPTGNS